MDSLLQISRQEQLERHYNRKHIDGYIREAIENIPENKAKVIKGAELLTNWLQQEFYDSKNARLEQLKVFITDFEKLVMDLFIGIAYVQKPQLFTSVTAKLASRLGFDDKKEAIQTVAEIVGILCMTDAFDITKEGRMASLMVVNRLLMPDQVLEFIGQSEYLPPMVCEPIHLESNYDSGYLTHKDSLILGKGNHHDGDICIDVLNTLNKVKLKLDTDFLRTFEEEKSSEMKTEEEFNEWVVIKKKHKQFPTYQHYVRHIDEMWDQFKSQSTKMYMHMHELGDGGFYLTNKVDKRGRIYAQGYHITTQGNPFKKACIDLANEEIVEGSFE